MGGGNNSRTIASKSGMGGLFDDLRHGARMLTAQPGVTLVAVAALALGIGANTAVFSVVDAVLLRPFPHIREAERVLQIWGSTPAKNIPFHGITYADVVDIRSQVRSLEAVSAMQFGAANLAGTGGGEPERVTAWRVNAGFFPLLGTGFAHGRGLLPEDDRPGAPGAAVLSYALWQRRFGSSPAAVGGGVMLDGRWHSIRGVLPREFSLPGRSIDVFTAIALPETREQRTASSPSQAIARLRPGATVEQAQAELDALIRRLQQDHQVETGRLKAWGLREFITRNLRTSVLVLLGAVLLVLLIACANVANLLLARGASRQREMAVRMALGASRWRLARLLLAESALLALLGGATGTALAWWGVRALSRLAPGGMPLVGSASVDAGVLAFTLLLTLATSLIFGAVPAVAASRGGSLHDALKQGGRAGEGFARNRMRGALVVVEVALSLVLLAGAGLLIRSFIRLNQVNPGIDPHGVLTAAITLPEARYGGPARKEAFFRELLAKLEATPGVESAGVTSLLPLGGSNNGVAIFLEGRPAPRRGELNVGWFRSVSGGYFRAMRIRLAEGRFFTSQDGPQAMPVAVVSETMARRYWPGKSALGERFTVTPPRPGVTRIWVTVVGVAGDLRHRGLNEQPEADVYFPYSQPPFSPSLVTVRTRDDPERFASVLRAHVREIDRDLPLSQVRTMDLILGESVSTSRLSMAVLTLFAAIALLLAAVGIYGVISFTVLRRTREIGLRMALGAMPRDIVRQVVGGALSLALAGVVIGIAGALALTRLMSSLLYGVTASDPLVFASVAALLTAVAALAGWVPARRASLLDPLAALREE